MLEKLNCFHLTSLKTLALLMWQWMGLFLRNINLLSCWGWLSLLNCIGSLTLSLLLKLPPRKLEPRFALSSFFLLSLLWVSTNLTFSFAKSFCHVWASAPRCFLELLDKLQKRICRAVGPSLAASWTLSSLFRPSYFGQRMANFTRDSSFAEKHFARGLKFHNSTST